MVTAQDEPVCDSWQLQGFWIGMPKQEALTLHAVEKTLKPGRLPGNRCSRSIPARNV